MYFILSVVCDNAFGHCSLHDVCIWYTFNLMFTSAVAVRPLFGVATATAWFYCLSSSASAGWPKRDLVISHLSVNPTRPRQGVSNLRNPRTVDLVRSGFAGSGCIPVARKHVRRTGTPGDRLTFHVHRPGLSPPWGLEGPF